MLTQIHCIQFDLSTHDERLGHRTGQIPCILSLCFFKQTFHGPEQVLVCLAYVDTSTKSYQV